MKNRKTGKKNLINVSYYDGFLWDWKKMYYYDWFLVLFLICSGNWGKHITSKYNYSTFCIKTKLKMTQSVAVDVWKWVVFHCLWLSHGGFFYWSQFGAIFRASLAKTHLTQEKEGDVTYQKRRASTCCHWGGKRSLLVTSLSHTDSKSHSVLTLSQREQYPF